MRREDLDNDDIRKLEEKRKRRMERADKKAQKEEKRQPRRDKNKIAIVGLVISCNAFILSFTGWYIWVAFIGLLLCLIGLGSKRPKNMKKFLALVGALLAAVAILNAVRVSSSWTVDESSLPVTETDVSE